MPSLTDLEQDGLQVRRAPAAQFEVEDGEFYGRAVPYGYEVDLFPGLTERFEPGCFARQVKDPGRVKIAYHHGEVIGHAVELTEREDGLYVRGRIVQDDDLPDGRKALAMLRNRLIDELSVGFQQVKNGSEVVTRESGTLVSHKRAALREVSITPWGAYGRKATVTKVRSADEARYWAEMRAQFDALGKIGA